MILGIAAKIMEAYY